jgi:hypothetical protein
MDDLDVAVVDELDAVGGLVLLLQNGGAVEPVVGVVARQAGLALAVVRATLVLHAKNGGVQVVVDGRFVDGGPQAVQQRLLERVVQVDDAVVVDEGGPGVEGALVDAHGRRPAGNRHHFGRQRVEHERFGRNGGLVAVWLRGFDDLLQELLQVLTALVDLLLQVHVAGQLDVVQQRAGLVGQPLDDQQLVDVAPLGHARGEGVAVGGRHAPNYHREGAGLGFGVQRQANALKAFDQPQHLVDGRFEPLVGGRHGGADERHVARDDAVAGLGKFVGTGDQVGVGDGCGVADIAEVDFVAVEMKMKSIEILIFDLGVEAEGKVSIVGVRLSFCFWFFVNPRLF